MDGKLGIHLCYNIKKMFKIVGVTITKSQKLKMAYK